VVVSAFGADGPPESMLKALENRYNQAKTLQVLFTEYYTPPGAIRRTESGILMLRRPGRMRWNYSQPAGKLIVSDNKYLWLYTPAANRVEKMKLKESDDMRVPMAFLLGKLDFSKEFRNIQAKPVEGGTEISCEPKSDNLPYSHVEFVVGPDQQIRQVKVIGFDNSILDFRFEQERLDPPLDSKLFQFQMPKGAELVETAQ
jgi:outer membrane lipoprotein carrier protein